MTRTGKFGFYQTVLSCLNLICRQFREEALKLTNAHRSRNGRGALTLDTTVGSDQPYFLPLQTFLFQLNQSTQQWAEQLAQSCKFYHRPKPWPRKARGENIAKNGSPTAERFINQWIKSPGHNRNVCRSFILYSYPFN